MAEEFQESDIVFNGNYIENEECHRLKKWFITDSSQDQPADDDHELLPRVKRKKVDDKLQKNDDDDDTKPKPMSIPTMSNRLAWLRRRYIEPVSLMFEYEYEYEDDKDHEMLVPPHVMIRRRLAEKMAFSVCSGMGRTLKGRDLSEMRNSVLRMTGFLET